MRSLRRASDPRLARFAGALVATTALSGALLVGDAKAQQSANTMGARDGTIAEFVVPQLAPGTYRIIIRPERTPAARPALRQPRQPQPPLEPQASAELTGDPSVTVRVPELILRVPALMIRTPSNADRPTGGNDRRALDLGEPTFSVRAPRERAPDAPRVDRAAPPIFDVDADGPARFTRRPLQQIADRRASAAPDFEDDGLDAPGEPTRPRAERRSSDDTLPMVRMRAPLASVRVKDEARSDTPQPTFDSALDEDLPQIRMRAPLASVRIDDGADRASRDETVARQTVAEPRFGAALDDDADNDLPTIRMRAPLASVRIDDADTRAASRERRAIIDDSELVAAERPDNVQRGEAPTFDDDFSSVIVPTQRDSELDEPADVRGDDRNSDRFEVRDEGVREDSGRDDRRDMTVTAPVFEDEVFAKPARRIATETKPKRDVETAAAPDDIRDRDADVAEAPRFGDAVDARRERAERTLSPGDTVADEAPRDRNVAAVAPERRALGDARDVTRVPEVPTVDRADDFVSDPVGVREAIARNRARYGIEAERDDDFFTLRGRYDWFKPVTRGAAGPDRDRSERRARRDAPAPRRRGADRDADSDGRDFGSVIELKGRDTATGADTDTADTAEFDTTERVTPPTFGPRVRGSARRPALQREARLSDPPDRGIRPDDRAGSETLLRRETRGPSYGPPVAVFGPRVAPQAAETRTATLGPPIETSEDPRQRAAAMETAARPDPETVFEQPRRTPDGVRTGVGDALAAPQFNRLSPVMAGYPFTSSWSGRVRGRGWIVIARPNSRIGDYLSLRPAARAGEINLRAPSQPGAYEVRFLSRDRRVILSRQRIEVTPAKVRLVALEFVDPDDELNVWWAGPGDGSDSLTLAPVGADDDRALARQSIGTGNPLKITAPTQPGEYEMRYVNGSDNRVMYRRKLVVAARAPKLPGP
ncbi:MAG: hypothetical protein AAFQ42_03505 [Pseudomonadota bacterium]